MTLKINGATGGSVSLDAPDNTSPAGTDVTLTLPTTAGSSGQYLQTNGTGALSWQTVAELPDAIDVNASAPADSVNIDSSGRLLVGTTSASGSHFFQVQGRQGNTTDYAGITLRRGSIPTTHSQGLGVISFTDNSENIGASISALSDDGSWSSGSSHRSRLVFSTTATGQSTPTERVRISQAGHIGLFGTDPTTEVRGLTSGYGFRIQRNSYLESAFDNNGYWILNNTQGAGTRYMVAFRTSGSDRGYITSDGAGVSYGSLSDYRLKENVVDLGGAIDRVKQLAPKRFNFIENPDKTIDGFLAHEAQIVVPEAVTGTHNEVDDDGNPVYQGIDQSKLVPLLTAALQEAIAKIETLETRLTALEGGAA